MNQKKVLDRIIEDLPFTMRVRAKKAVEKYKAEKREQLTLEIVRELYWKVVNETKK